MIVRHWGAGKGIRRRRLAAYLAIGRKESAQKARISILVILFLLHLLLVRTGLSFFVCSPVFLDDARGPVTECLRTELLDADPTVTC